MTTTARPYSKGLALALLSTLFLMRHDDSVATAYSTTAVVRVRPEAETRRPTGLFQTGEKVSYNLGIGRHRPVGIHHRGKPAAIVASPGGVVDNVEAATHFLVEYESTREFPSPLLLLAIKKKDGPYSPAAKNNEAAAAAVTTTAGQQTLFPPLIPSRVTDDSVLKIHYCSSHHHHFAANAAAADQQQQPRAVAQQAMTNHQKFDLNTAWIEMLIHEQRQQHRHSIAVAAAATS